MLRFFFSSLALAVVISSLSSVTAEAQAYNGFEIVANQTKLKLLSPEFSQLQTERITLKNGLKAYIVSDPLLPKSGAALTVNVGSWNEPVDHPGLAHFLEHMLFMGTKKYPDESEYSAYITEHGGVYNAYTSDDLTAYLFVISNDHFKDALDRFSQFFKEPLFDPSALSREIKSIDQEYSKNINDDDFREYYILKSLAPTTHPFHRFGMGNMESLKNSSREDIINWYQSNYSADLMSLIIYSSLPIDELVSLVKEEFESIPQKPHSLTPAPENILENLQGKLLTIRPVKNLQKLSVVWELPALYLKKDESRPQLLVSAILGEEGPGSLLSLLKEEHLAEGISTGSQSIGNAGLLLSVEIDLTEQGAQNPQAVINKVFQAIALLKNQPFPEYYFNDLQQIQKIKYEQQSRTDLFNYLADLSSLIVEEPLSSFPEHAYVIQSFKPEEVKELVEQLTPSKAIYILSIPNYQNEAMKQEKWLGGAYTIEAMPEKFIAEWTEAKPNPLLHYPNKNPFIPKNLLVRTKPNEVFPTPIRVLDNDYGRFYFASDTLYITPKVTMEFIIHTPKIALDSARSIVLADIYVKAVTEALNSISYPAAQAGLKLKIDRVNNTIKIRLDGFDEKSVPLLLTVADVLSDMEITEKQFDKITAELQRNYENGAKESPLNQGFEVLKSVIYKNYQTDRQKALALSKIHLKHFKLFSKHLFNKFYIEAMLFGNISETQAKEIATSMISKLEGNPYPVIEQIKPQVVYFSEHRDPVLIERTIELEGNATILAIDNGQLAPKSRAVQQIFNQAVNDPFYAELRAKQQTGYLVFNEAAELEKSLFTLFAVQSTTHSARDLLSRFELFLESYLQELQEGKFSKQSFDNIKASIITQLKQKPKNYSDMGTLLEKLAFDYDDDFLWLDKRIKALEELSYEEYLKEAQKLFGKENKNRLAILMTGSQEEPKLINYRTVKNIKILRPR